MAEQDPPKPLPREALAPADAPWPSNPAFTRKEAGEAKARGTVPMTAEMAELAFDLCENHGLTMPQALQRLGFSKHALKKALNAEPLRMVQLRAYEQAGGSDELESTVLVESLKASHVKQVKEEGKMVEKSYPDHHTRLAGLDRVLELKGLGSRRSRRDHGDDADARPVLNIQAPCNIQLVYFGEAKDAPDAGRPE